MPCRKLTSATRRPDLTRERLAAGRSTENGSNRLCRLVYVGEALRSPRVQSARAVAAHGRTSIPLTERARTRDTHMDRRRRNDGNRYGRRRRLRECGRTVNGSRPEVRSRWTVHVVRPAERGAGAHGACEMQRVVRADEAAEIDLAVAIDVAHEPRPVCHSGVERIGSGDDVFVRECARARVESARQGGSAAVYDEAAVIGARVVIHVDEKGRRARDARIERAAVGGAAEIVVAEAVRLGERARENRSAGVIDEEARLSPSTSTKNCGEPVLPGSMPVVPWSLSSVVGPHVFADSVEENRLTVFLMVQRAIGRICLVYGDAGRTPVRNALIGIGVEELADGIFERSISITATTFS